MFKFLKSKKQKNNEAMELGRKTAEDLSNAMDQFIEKFAEIGLQKNLEMLRASITACSGMTNEKDLIKEEFGKFYDSSKKYIQTVKDGMDKTYEDWAKVFQEMGLKEPLVAELINKKITDCYERTISNALEIIPKEMF